MTDDQRQRLNRSDQVSFVPMEAVGENGGLNLDLIRNKEAVEKGYTLFFDGDVVVAKITPCFENRKGALAQGLHNGVAYGTTELHVLTPSAALDSKFLFYVTISDDFRVPGEAAMKGAAGQKRVTDQFIQDYRLLLPPLPTQRRVVDFLDTEVNQIDELVAEKKRMVALLDEKRRTFTIRLVTRGLNASVQMKDSSQAWLGEIPSHWKVRRNACLFRERDERGEPDLPLLEVSINTGVMLREFSEERIETVAADFNSYKIARKGDIAFNKMRMWQGAVGVAPVDGLVSPDYTVATPLHLEELFPEYIEHLFRTPSFGVECSRHSNGIVWDRLRLYWDGFRDIRVPVPPLDEQKAIVTAIEKERARTAEFETALRHSITLLKERRAALITAAVTGALPISE